MKKIPAFLAIFIIFTILVTFCPWVTTLDRSCIIAVQKTLSGMPLVIPTLPDCILYSILIGMPIILFGGYFIWRKKWFDVAFLASIPLITYLLNKILKLIIQRPRPPFELQIGDIHPESFSYVSSHSLVTCCLWGMVIYYINKYCPNRNTRIFGTTFAVLWILYVGLSRIWLGVHHPTDVLGAYILGMLLISIFIKIGDRA